MKPQVTIDKNDYKIAPDPTTKRSVVFSSVKKLFSIFSFKKYVYRGGTTPKLEEDEERSIEIRPRTKR